MPTGDIGGTAADASVAGTAVSAEGWDAIRANGDIQFAPVRQPEPDPPPEWLLEFSKFFERIFRPVAEFLGISWPVLKWILLGIVAAALLLLIWRLVEPLARIRIQRQAAEDDEEEWTPDREEAIALLDDADRLAAEGRYDEAAHLLLMRSVNQIATARPDWLEPSSTAREIATLSALPDRARTAFATIAGHVERSLFALKRLDAQDWQAARDAYSDFALADFGADFGADLGART